MRSAESVLNAKYKITGLNAVAPVIIPGILLLNVKGKLYYVTAFVLAMTVDTVSRFVKLTTIAHVVKNVSMEVVDLHVL